MAFVNEWISQEDIEKYGLVALFTEYSKDDSKYTAVKNPKDEIDWTVDRKREIWLIDMASAVSPDSKFPSPTQETIFILHYEGNNVEVRLWWEPVSKPKETPIRISWKYLSMKSICIKNSDEKQLKIILREAIHTYKQFGIRNRRTAITEIVCIGFEGVN
jgi:hypothetical protein